jgi:hypothetical protein
MPSVSEAIMVTLLRQISFARREGSRSHPTRNHNTSVRYLALELDAQVKAIMAIRVLTVEEQKSPHSSSGLVFLIARRLAARINQSCQMQPRAGVRSWHHRFDKFRCELRVEKSKVPDVAKLETKVPTQTP